VSRKRTLLLVVFTGLVAMALMTSCGQAELGSEENPIVWAFVPSSEAEEVTAGAEALATLLEEETGLFFDILVTTEYAGAVEAMCAEPPEAHVGSLATFSYVLANERCGVDASLVAVRFGSPTYNGQIIAGADTGITEIADLEGSTFCRPDPLSTSGWIIPMLTMRANGINPDTDLTVQDAGGHDAVVASIYNGECDAGATYVDARGAIEDQYADVMDVVMQVAVTEEIPNDGVQFAPELDEEIRSNIANALLTISETEEGQEAMEIAYEWDGLVERSDQFYDPFRQVLQASGMSIEDLTE